MLRHLLLLYCCLIKVHVFIYSIEFRKEKSWIQISLSFLLFYHNKTQRTLIEQHYATVLGSALFMHTYYMLLFMYTYYMLLFMCTYYMLLYQQLHKTFSRKYPSPPIEGLVIWTPPPENFSLASYIPSKDCGISINLSGVGVDTSGTVQKHVNIWIQVKWPIRRESLS